MSDSDLRIREAGLTDLIAVVDLHNASRAVSYRDGGGLTKEEERELDDASSRTALTETWARAISSTRRQVVCAANGGTLLGVLSTGPPIDTDLDPGTAWQLYQIHVHPEHWGEGAGSQLHEEFVRQLKESPKRLGVLEVWEKNARAQSFYTHRGWLPDGHARPGPGGADYCRMLLELR